MMRRWLLLSLWLNFCLLGCGGQVETAVSTQPLIIPTPTAAPTEAVIIATIPTTPTPGPSPTPTATPTTHATATQPPPTPTPDPLADLRLGFVADDAVCQWLTDIVAATLVEELGMRVEKRPFADSKALMASLAASSASSSHATLCFRDPSQRPLLQAHGDQVQLVGSGYWTDGVERRLVVIKTAVSTPLQTNHPCAHHLLTNLNLDTIPLTPENPTRWRSRNQPQLQAWLDC